jgi:hypothetical protein
LSCFVFSLSVMNKSHCCHALPLPRLEIEFCENKWKLPIDSGNLNYYEKCSFGRGSLIGWIKSSI